MLAPPARRAATRRRQAKWRARVREGRACYRFEKMDARFVARVERAIARGLERRPDDEPVRAA